MGGMRTYRASDAPRWPPAAAAIVARRLSRRLASTSIRRACVLVVASVALLVPLSARAAAGPVALVTAETENELVAVNLVSGQILKRVSLPSDPEYVGVDGATVVVVSGRAGAVSLLGWPSLHLLKVLRGFGAPHLVAFAPDRKWA